MGRLVPEDFPLSTLINDAEVRVVEALRDGLTDGWLILPDVALRGHPERQLDVVLLHEQWGIVDLEVKGHRMQLREGMWCSDGSVLAPQPGAQAKDNAYALRSALRATGGDLAHVDVEYGLAFPNTTAIEGRLPTGLDRAQVLTASDLENPQDAIEALASVRWHQALSRAAIEAVLAVLRPDALLTWDPEARARAARSRLDDLCAMQVGALETLDGNRRVFVTGRAGTGKTRLAMGWARRAWRRDERVLLTCYNDPLAQSLRSQLAFADEDLVIGSFLQVALRLDGMPSLSIPADADHEWWNTVALDLDAGLLVVGVAGVLPRQQLPGRHPPRVDPLIVGPRHSRRRAAAGPEQAGGQLGDPVAQHHLGPPLGRGAAGAPASPGQLASDGGGGVGVVAQVGGPQHSAAEVGRTANGPQRGLERVNAVARAPDRRRLLALPTSLGH